MYGGVNDWGLENRRHRHECSSVCISEDAMDVNFISALTIKEDIDSLQAVNITVNNFF